MATDDYIFASAVEAVEKSGRDVAMLRSLRDYSVPDSLRRAGEDTSATRARIDLCVRELEEFLKSWAVHAQDPAASAAEILPCSEDMLCEVLLRRAKALGLDRSEVRGMVDFVVLDVFLNRGIARSVPAPTDDGPVYKSVQVAESVRGGIRLKNEYLAALLKLEDMEEITGVEFDFAEYLIRSRVESGTRDEVIEAFRYANTVLVNQMVALSALREKVRTQETFRSMDPVSVSEELRSNREKMKAFVNESLPNYFLMFVHTRENAEAAPDEVQEEAQVRKAIDAMKRELAKSKTNLGRLVSFYDAVLKDIASCARSSRSIASRGVLSFDREVTAKLSNLSVDGLAGLPAFLLHPLAVSDAGEGLCYPEMFLDFKFRRRDDSGSGEFDMTPLEGEGEGEKDAGIDGIMEVYERMEADLREALRSKESVRLSEFLDGLPQDRYEEYLLAGADWIKHAEKEWTYGLGGGWQKRSCRVGGGGVFLVGFDDVVLARKEGAVL